MSLKSFLQEKGYIERDAEKIAEKKGNSTASQAVEPTYFPFLDPDKNSGETASADAKSFEVPVTPVQNQTENIDKAFIKFYEDELAKTNFPGPDYFEFRKQMTAMHQKIGNKGTPPEVILQAVLTSFEAQNVSSAKLVEAAKQYKTILENKKDEFLKGAAAEKDKQLQKRQNALKAHQDNLSQMQSQLLQLQTQMKQLQDMVNREQTQMEVDRTLGREGIEKIERAEKQITLAYNYMVGTIDTDIEQLRSA